MMNKKSIIFNEFLVEKEIKCFRKKEITDEFGTVIFDSHLEVNGDRLPLIIINDISIYTIIRVMLLKEINLKKKKELLTKINKLNGEYKAFKYYTKENSLFLDVCVPCNSDNYNSEIIYTLLDVLLKHLAKEYESLVKYKK